MIYSKTCNYQTRIRKKTIVTAFLFHIQLQQVWVQILELIITF